MIIHKPGKRILFGPPKSYSTATYELLKYHPLTFHTTKYKEFVDFSKCQNLHQSVPLDIIDTHEKYLNGYDDSSKWFVDCSLYYYNAFHYKKLQFSPLAFDTDILIYFVRNFYDVVRSRYKFDQLKGYTHITVKDVINNYDFSAVKTRLTNIKYIGNIILVQGFQLNNILHMILNLDITVNEKEIYNSQKLYHVGVSDNTLLSLNEQFLKEFEINRGYALRIAENNIKLFNQHEILNGFNKDEYLRGML